MEDNPYSDSQDSFKWDFDQSSLRIKYDHRGYPYLVAKDNNLRKLVELRSKINQLCANIVNDIENRYDVLNRIAKIRDEKCADLLYNFDYYLSIFLDLHYEHPRNEQLPHIFSVAHFKNQGNISKYVISEIPAGTKFNAINKPRLRYLDNGIRRARYRHILIDLRKTGNSLKNLLIHELAHSMANHVLWVDDNHYSDFQICEKFIHNYWPK